MADRNAVTTGGVSQAGIILRCDGCGAPVDESLSRCAYCDTPRNAAVKLETEIQALLALLEVQLEDAVKLRTDFPLIVIFFLFILSGPACYMALGLYTDTGIFMRIVTSIVTALFGFFLFGWQCDAREIQAENIAWRELVADEIARFTASKDLSATDFLGMARRLLPAESRLHKVLLKWMPSAAR